MKTLAEAKAEFFEGARGKGAICPCCGQFGKVYKRKIHSGMAAILVLLYRHQNLGFVHVLTLLSSSVSPAVAAHIGGGDFAKLRFWGFIEEKQVATKKGRMQGNGEWRITGEGARFVEGSIETPKYIWLYNDSFLGFHGEQVSIYDALGEKFSYAELMGQGV